MTAYPVAHHNFNPVLSPLMFLLGRKPCLVGKLSLLIVGHYCAVVRACSKVFVVTEVAMVVAAEIIIVVT